MDPETRELRALEEEVAALQRECRMLQNLEEKTSGAWKSFKKFSQSDSEEWESLKDLRSQLGHLKSELSFLSKLTGFNIRNYSKMEDIGNTEQTENDTKKVLQRHRLSGNCNMVTFQLEFEVLEIETKEKKSSIITDLSIIMEPTEYSELSEFASRAEEKRDLLMFFRSLHFFVEWYEYRENTFKHFKERYPDSVYLSEGTCSHCMEIRNARLPGFELVIVWRIQIDEEGKVFPKLDLLTKVPEQALEMDKNRVIETAPLSFRSLLGVLGIEAALDSLIRLFNTDK
ncbi:rCG44155, isoform CRA_b [Rattus norvegicus]|uniref:Centromere protein P n=3 Tax=Rattus norvegicus TaxID=10116 RepID=A0A1W2Q6F6_RAT|nr:centromere protein P [Rattus norvegicus]EDL98107.1 rCG44155, isoform CRA_b [Rattus norvegicus]|eukprot:XP_006253806.1 PREDICTED: centromere protein P isoform X1 [Rattus norvegicus]